MAGIRAAITAGNFSDFLRQTREGWAHGDMAPRARYSSVLDARDDWRKTRRE